MACQTIIVLALVCVKYAVTLNCDFDNECDWEANDFGIGSYMEVLKREDTDIANRLMRSRLVDNQGDFAYAHAPVGVLSTVTSGWGSEDTGNVCVIFDAFVTGTESTTEDVHVNVNVNTEIKGNRNISQTVELNGNGRWHEVKINLGKLQGKFRVQLAFGALDRSAWIAVDNITLSYDCEEDDNGCTGTDVFACDNSTCISWDHVCNLQSDCDNGRDEDPVLCENVFTGAMTESVCTFEDGLCGWTNVKDKRDSGLDWTRHNGPSPTENTGPNIDHTIGTDAGHYIYIESNDGRIFDYAILESMVFPEIQEQSKYKNGQTTGICKVRFFYHMYGRVLGRIELWVDDLCGSRRKQIMLWEKEGLKSDQKWHYAEVPITNTSSRYTLQFKGTRSDLPHGDIALDDICLSPECFGIQHDKEKYLIDTATVDIVSLDEFHDQRAAYCAYQNDATDISSVTEKPSNVMQSLTETSSHAQGHTPDIQSVMVEPQKLNVGYVIFIIAAASIFTLVLGAIILCLALRRRNKRQHQAAHLEMITNSSEQIFTNGPVQSTIDMQLRCAVTELNPNYDFINAIYPETQLREIPRNKMTLIHMLGQGAFGEVYEGRLRNLCANVRELPVAVKTLPALSTEQAEKDFVMEAIIISKFMHKNVVKCLGVCFKEPPKYIVLELLQGGDLRTFLRESRPTRDQDCILVMGDLVKLALDVANGCHHLEEKHFVHRDIAARNCLLTSRGPDRVAKIADFGMSRDIYSSDYYRKGGKAMLPIKWMPPEAFLDGVFTTKTDVWSFGILLWEIVTLGHMPYPGQTNSDVMHSVASGGRLDPPENCPARLNKIMLMCWNSVPEIRPSFCEIIEHLDMCLQDPEVMETNLSECHLPIGDIFKDASTLTKHSESESMATGGTSDSLSPENSAQYGKFLESQSQEPLLPPKESEEEFNS